MLTDEQIMENVPFIYDAFNYYNGKINLFPVYRFEVSMLETPRPQAAITRLPGVITVFPFAFKYLKTADVEYFRYYMLESIIHELYHIDQNIRYDIVKFDPAYVDRIESNVEIIVSSYMLTHAEEIYNRFSVDVCRYIDRDYVQGCIRPTFYERKTYEQHIINTVYAVIDKYTLDQNNIDTNDIRTALGCICREYSINGVIVTLKINDQSLDLYDRGIVRIEPFNNFIYRNYTMYNDYNISIYSGMEDLEYGRVRLIIGVNLESITKMVDYAMNREVQ